MADSSNLPESWKVLVVGNNPIELSLIADRLKGIDQKDISTEMAFDLKTILQRLISFRPQHIVIDDNIGKILLHQMVDKLNRKKTRDVPITIIKNSNYHETIGAGVMNFVLKRDLTSDNLYRELSNSARFLQTQKYWAKAYRKRQWQLERILQAVIN